MFTFEKSFSGDSVVRNTPGFKCQQLGVAEMEAQSDGHSLHYCHRNKSLPVWQHNHLLMQFANVQARREERSFLNIVFLYYSSKSMFRM